MAHPLVDRLIAELAAAQHDVVSWWQLAELGVSARMIQWRLEQGWLRKVYRGVYAVGLGPLTRYGHFNAAVLACGPGAALSHRSAGALWGFVHDDPRRTHVSTTRHVIGPDLVCVHRVRRGVESERNHAIPVTTVARTLLDLAATLKPHPLATAVHESEVLELFDLRAIAVIASNNGHRGTGALRRAVEAWRPDGQTRSRLEADFLQRVVAADLPRPRTNPAVDVGHRLVTVDFLWPAQRVIVELDGRTHRTQRKFEEDRIRDAELRLAGYEAPLRFTTRRFQTAPHAVIDTVARVLGVRA